MIATQEALNTWFILRGEAQDGPYDYPEMIRRLQRNELYDYSYVWAPHMESWTPLGETPEFARDRLARLQEKDEELKSAFIQRTSVRASVLVPVYGHDNRLFFQGSAISISNSGALLVLKTPLLLPDQSVLLHFRGGAGIDAFNVQAQIVRKNFSRARLSVRSGLQYAVRFSEISQQGLFSVEKLIKETNRLMEEK